MTGGGPSVASQGATVLRMLTGNPQGITSWDAISHAGITRLASRVHELRAAGHNIVDRWEQSNGKRYVRYQLIRPEPPLTVGEQAEMFGK